MKFQFSHIPLIWIKIKNAYTYITVSGKKKRTILAFRLCLDILLTILLAIYYSQSYRIPTRNLDFEILDTLADSLIISNWNYSYCFQDDTLFHGLEITGRGSCFSEYKDSINNLLIPVDSNTYRLTDELKKLYPDLSFIEDINYPANSELDKTKSMLAINIEENIPQIPFPYHFRNKIEHRFEEYGFAGKKVSEYIIDHNRITIHSVNLYNKSRLYFTEIHKFTVSNGIKLFIRSEDFSQFNFTTSFSLLNGLELAVDTLTIFFDSTIQPSNMYPEPTETGSDYIRFIGRDKTSSIIRNGLSFHVTNPEQSSAILVKIFILTAILTLMLDRILSIGKQLFRTTLDKLYKKRIGFFLFTMAVLILYVCVLIIKNV